MTTTEQTRRTSVYYITLAARPGADLNDTLDAILRRAAHAGYAVASSAYSLTAHTVAVGLRLPGGDRAAQEAAHRLSPRREPLSIHTGYGAHRRNLLTAWTPEETDARDAACDECAHAPGEHPTDPA